MSISVLWKLKTASAVLLPESVNTGIMTQKQKKVLAGAAAAAVAGLVTCIVCNEREKLEVNEYDIGHPERGGTPLRLLQLSDLHLHHRIAPRHLRLAETVRNLRPDLILLTGDTLGRGGLAFALDRFLLLLPTEVPKVAILGNHDYRNGISVHEFRRIYARHNGTLLVNESIAYQLGSTRLLFTGLDDCIRGVSDFARAVCDVGAETHHLVLIHSPLQQEDVLRQLPVINAQRTPSNHLKPSYFFAGHIHGGQIRLFGYAPYLPKKSGRYLKGWYNNTNPYMYVSKGFGTSLLPLRLGAQPEVTLFRYFP